MWRAAAHRHYWVATLTSVHAVAAYDISDLAHIREVSRLTFDDKQKPHWISADADHRRIILNSGEYGEHRLFMVNFDPQTGALTLDKSFRDPGSDKPGVSMDGKILAARLQRRRLSPRGGVFASRGRSPDVFTMM